MKYSRPVIHRLMIIDQRIRENKYPNCTSLAREIEVSPKTIARDIQYMRDMIQAPIEFDARRNGYYYAKPNYFFPALQLSEKQIISLIIHKRFLTQYENTPYYEDIKTAIQQILSFIPDREDVEQDADFVSFEPLPSSKIEREYFELLQQAILNEQRVNIAYHAYHSGEQTKRLVDPYLLHNHYANWYLIGYCHLRGDVRIFALSRIIQIEPTQLHFRRPRDFSIEKLLQHSFNLICGGEIYHVVLKFTPYQARWIRERRWHNTQKLTELEDGGLMMEMDVQGLQNVLHWVLQFGAEVEVIAPEVLRKSIKREIEKMRELY
ncbi:MAG: WYL domain-containing protein [candidate division KSB1 bacterium]|nr:WYL domain-containing protein [candidate division KSB1 bacterium]